MQGSWFVVLLLSFIVQPSFGKYGLAPDLGENKIVYLDITGKTWIRHILTESRLQHRTLLLVIDVPSDKSLRQQVVYRRSFAASEQSLLEKAIQNAAHIQSMSKPVTSLRVSPNSVWNADHDWTAADEQNYATWLQANASVNFLVGSGVVADCADYAITLRWIYAHDHNLPAGDQLAATGALIGSWSSSAEWDNLPTDPDWRNDQRFKAALKYVLDNTFTHSLFTDLYPVTITPGYVNPGAIYLTLVDDSGHTRTIYNIGTGGVCPDSNPCISIIWGNEPASEDGFTSVLVPWHLDPTAGGFLRFRWPVQTNGVWQLVAAAQMPGYSTEQYEWTPAEYLTNVTRRLNIYMSPEMLYVTAGQLAADDLVERMILTSQGYFVCSIVPCATTDPLYSEWSTPVRDKTLEDEIASFQLQINQIDPNNEAVITFQDQMTTQLFAGSQFTILDFISGNVNPTLDGNPNDDFFARWGLSGLTTQQQLLALADVAYINWQFRDNQVLRAQAACFPDGGTTPQCNTSDPAIKALSTDRLDQAIRLFQATFGGTFQSASSDDQNAVATYLQTQQTKAAFCPNPSDSLCTMYDFLINGAGHLATMKSNPDAPLASRYGF